MRSLLLATLVFGSGWFVSEARAQTGGGYGGGSLMIGSGLTVPGYYPGAYGYQSPYYGGGAWNGFGPPLVLPAPVYAGYRGHISYGYRSFGRGRTFGAYQPRFYPVYQPRPYGMFDR